jgi:hypothetical protein
MSSWYDAIGQSCVVTSRRCVYTYTQDQSGVLRERRSSSKSYPNSRCGNDVAAAELFALSTAGPRKQHGRLQAPLSTCTAGCRKGIFRHERCPGPRSHARQDDRSLCHKTFGSLPPISRSLPVCSGAKSAALRSTAETEESAKATVHSWICHTMPPGRIHDKAATSPPNPSIPIAGQFASFQTSRGGRKKDTLTPLSEAFISPLVSLSVASNAALQRGCLHR